MTDRDLENLSLHTQLAAAEARVKELEAEGK